MFVFCPAADVYKRKHNPCPMYASIAKMTDANVGYDAFLRDLAANKLPMFSFIAPDQVRAAI